MNQLIMLIGIPGSGKSYYAEHSHRLQEKAIVCPDKIRLEVFKTKFHELLEPMVWSVVQYMVKSYLSLGLDVIFDATNVSRKRRASVFDMVAKETEVIGIWFQTPYALCLERRKGFPVEVMERMRDSFEEPTLDEGFSVLIPIETGGR